MNHHQVQTSVQATRLHSLIPTASFPVSHAHITVSFPYHSLMPISQSHAHITVSFPYHSLMPISLFGICLTVSFPYQSLMPISQSHAHISIWHLPHSLIPISESHAHITVSCPYHSLAFAKERPQTAVGISHQNYRLLQSTLAALMQTTKPPTHKHSFPPHSHSHPTQSPAQTRGGFRATEWTLVSGKPHPTLARETNPTPATSDPLS